MERYIRLMVHDLGLEDQKEEIDEEEVEEVEEEGEEDAEEIQNPLDFLSLMKI